MAVSVIVEFQKWRVFSLSVKPPHMDIVLKSWGLWKEELSIQVKLMKKVLG